VYIYFSSLNKEQNSLNIMHYLILGLVTRKVPTLGEVCQIGISP